MRRDGRLAAGRLGKRSAADVAEDFAAGTAENDLFVLATVAFDTQESALGTVCVIHFSHSLLDEFKLLCSEALSLVRFLAGVALVFQEDLLGRLVASRNLGEFTGVTDTGLSLLLSGDHRQGRCFSFLDSFNGVLCVLFAERTVCSELLRDFHDISPFDS